MVFYWKAIYPISYLMEAEPYSITGLTSGLDIIGYCANLILQMLDSAGFAKDMVNTISGISRTII